MPLTWLTERGYAAKARSVGRSASARCACCTFTTAYRSSVSALQGVGGPSAWGGRGCGRRAAALVGGVGRGCVVWHVHCASESLPAMQMHQSAAAQTAAPASITPPRSPRRTHHCTRAASCCSWWMRASNEPRSCSARLRTCATVRTEYTQSRMREAANWQAPQAQPSAVVGTQKGQQEACYRQCSPPTG